MQRRTFALEVGGFEVSERVVAEAFWVEAAWIRADQVACLQPCRQPLHVTVAVERVRQQIAACTAYTHNYYTQLHTTRWTATPRDSCSWTGSTADCCMHSTHTQLLHTTTTADSKLPQWWMTIHTTTTALSNNSNLLCGWWSSGWGERFIDNTSWTALTFYYTVLQKSTPLNLLRYL